MMKPDNLDDKQLIYLVRTTDKELFDAGLDIRQRGWEVPQAVMRKLGYISFVTTGDRTSNLLERIGLIFSSIYRKQDMAIGGHIGVFMFRDIFAKIGVPHIYGLVEINPFEFVELTKIQLTIIQTEPDQMETYLDQFLGIIPLTHV